MLTVGLDVHFRKSSLCILDANGKIAAQRQVHGHWDKVVAKIKLPDDIRDWFRRTLMAWCHDHQAEA